ncbi:EF-hand and coiled-coil domain-containing protein 1 [Callorhinchus milii]|uniref:EF-hand and coiled-coil domain-containing protein 1 n=1 Tax=Callorhinchus milii TaxID=7868 RepID=UPI001C3F57F6|nr:EF-hand and coiled-coil domain-containing protein 1 [Callorhinchus milii]
MSSGLGLLTPRPARRSGWLASVLAHHLGSETDTVDNEVVVLATGIDQYLQEIFHHLNYEGDGFISSEDFLLLCSVLGLEGQSDEIGHGHELGDGQATDLPRELAFKDFHARLCGYFFKKSGQNPERLPVGKETEHVERQIQLRCPRIRRGRRNCVPFDLAKAWMEKEMERPRARGQRQKPQQLLKQEDNLHPCSEEQGEDCLARLELELENASLRELVEDLRGSLQSSDARCLALEVALRKIHGAHDPQTWPRRREQRAGGGEEISSARQQTRGCKSLLRELELIRSSRDGQISEAMRFNQQVEEELKETQGRLLKWEQWLREMRRKAEEGRRALVMGLETVKDLESRANLVPDLRSKVLQLELELNGYRSQGVGADQVPAFPGCSPLHQERCGSYPQPSRRIPAGKANPSSESSVEHLLRAVEGRAASDEEEEEEERCTEEQSHQATELRRVLHPASCCEEGCQSHGIRQILSCNCCWRGNADVSSAREERRKLAAELKARDGRAQELESEIEKLTCSMAKELQLKGEEVEMLRMELQMVETDRVRLSLVEEKLTDVLQLLRHLQVLNISRRSLGKILLNTLNACYVPGHETSSSLDVLNSLSKELLSCELLSDMTAQRKQQQLENSLIISC